MQSKPLPIDPELDALLKRTKEIQDSMTPAQRAEQSLRQSVSYVRGEMGIEHPDWSEERLNEVIQHMPQAWALAEIDRLRAALRLDAMFAKAQSPAMTTAKEIAEAFRSAPVKADLQGHGISRMSVRWRDKDVCLGWFSSGNPDDLIIGGDRSFPKGPESDLIFRAAKVRADGLLQERLTALANSKE